jgi:hypothetical protein
LEEIRRRRILTNDVYKDAVNLKRVIHWRTLKRHGLERKKKEIFNYVSRNFTPLKGELEGMRDLIELET